MHQPRQGAQNPKGTDWTVSLMPGRYCPKAVSMRRRGQEADSPGALPRAVDWMPGRGALLALEVSVVVLVRGVAALFHPSS